MRQYLPEHTDEQDDGRQPFTFKHESLGKWEDDDSVNNWTAKATIDLTHNLSAKTDDAVSANGQHIILQPPDQHEVEALRRLHDDQCKKQPRIILLLDIADGNLTTEPLRTPLLRFLDLNFGAWDGVVELLALRFLEHVAHLQHSSVAHLDLKPENIVVQRDPDVDEGGPRDH